MRRSPLVAVIPQRDVRTSTCQASNAPSSPLRIAGHHQLDRAPHVRRAVHVRKCGGAAEVSTCCERLQTAFA
jgi:hypothetical protein